jgi:hypothetical protein
MRFIFLALLTALSSVSYAQQLDGKLLMYPGGHNLSDMPASAIGKSGATTKG